MCFTASARATRKSGTKRRFLTRLPRVNMGGVLAAAGSIRLGLDGQLFLAIDRSGGPTNNNIYMLASVVPAGRSTTDVMFVRSTDGG